MKYSIHITSAQIFHCEQYFKHMLDCQVSVKRRGGLEVKVWLTSPPKDSLINVVAVGERLASCQAEFCLFAFGTGVKWLTMHFRQWGCSVHLPGSWGRKETKLKSLIAKLKGGREGSGWGDEHYWILQMRCYDPKFQFLIYIRDEKAGQANKHQWKHCLYNWCVAWQQHHKNGTKEQME